MRSHFVYPQLRTDRGYRCDPAIKRVLIVGADHVGWSAAKAVRQFHPHCEIYVVGEASPTAQLQNNGLHRRATEERVHGWPLLTPAPMSPVPTQPKNPIRWMNIASTAIESHMRRARLADGTTLTYDRLILSTNGQSGTESTLALAKSCGLRARRGILIDHWMRTSDPFIFAIGDLAEFDDRTGMGSWHSLTQPELAAASAVVGPGVSLQRFLAESSHEERYVQ
ncbi:MAG: FAD-dependent oxidoreductase [Caldilineaceae bacterium]